MGEASQPCGDDARMKKLEKEKKKLLQRLEFVEELIGPTEAQRKEFQELVLAARSAAIRAKHRGASVPTKLTGRLDERLVSACGLSECDAGLLQGGCLPDEEGILQDVSLLGDPTFRPYDERTGEPRWQAKGGAYQISLGEVQDRYGDNVALDVVRCARELDKYDASRRIGIELPWHPTEDRELEPAEVIDLMDRELSLQTNLAYFRAAADWPLHEVVTSPYAVSNVPPRRPRGGRHPRRRASSAATHGGVRNGGIASSSVQTGAVVPLPHVDTGRRAPEMQCALPGFLRRTRMHEPLDHPLLGSVRYC